jgi:4-hydroxy-tetrahydrodipicolinate reductase
MPNPLPVIVQGLGPIGRKIAQAAQRDAGLDVVAASDIDRRLIGRDLAELDPDDDQPQALPSGIIVRPSLGLARADAEEAGATAPVVLHATGSYLSSTAPQLEEALQLGLSVVSTCEELAYPFVRHPEISKRLDALAISAGCTLVGTGVNPGFLMDQLVVALSGASHDIRSVTVKRVQDPTPRREPFQHKVGLNITRAQYDARAESGEFGHVGLVESGRLIAAGLGWQIDDWTDTLEPVQPNPDGLVLGMLEILEGTSPDGHTVRLHWEAQGGVDESYDEIIVDGTPPLTLRFIGGVFGDDATSAAVLRAAKAIPSAAPGLLTVLDLPLRARPAVG